MYAVVNDFDVSECHTGMFAGDFVVIARHVDDLDVVAGPLEAFLNDGILRGRPEYAAFHRPEIDDVPEQEQMLGFTGSKKFKQAFGLTRAGAKVYIGQKDATNLPRRLVTAVAGCHDCLGWCVYGSPGLTGLRTPVCERLTSRLRSR